MVSTAWSLTTESPQDTRRIAAALGGLLRGGEVIGLVGDLGTGKTCFTQGLAEGLEVPPTEYVRSPTFALINVHAGRVPLYHVDLYRLEDPDESVYVGYDDLFDGLGVIAVEWFDRFPELWPACYLRLDLVDLGGARRGIEATPVGTGSAELLARWKEALTAAPAPEAEPDR